MLFYTTYVILSSYKYELYYRFSEIHCDFTEKNNRLHKETLHN